MTETRTIWRPSAQMIEAANATRLARALGCADYDALLERSLSDPAGYWDMADRFCGIRWRVPYEGYVDLSRGREFPVFFPGAVHLLADLPKTRSGKVMRRVIRSVYSGLPAGDMSSLANPDTLDEIRRCASAGAKG